MVKLIVALFCVFGFVYIMYSDYSTREKIVAGIAVVVAVYFLFR